MPNYEQLKKIANKIRRLSLSLINRAEMGHPGGALSQTDILTALYFNILNVKPENPHWEERDRFVYSKGHTCASLYVTLAIRGFFQLKDLENMGELDSHLQSHPDKNKTPGVENSSGSLGQGLSLAVGMALAARLKKRNYIIYALLGDGECDEGQVWEAAMSASHYKLNNLILMIDHNKLQAKGPCKEIMNIEPLSDKWKAFGWDVWEMDGHNFEDIITVINKAKTNGRQTGNPNAIITHTIKGKGVSFMENVCKWHNLPPDDQELKAALQELGGAIDG